MPNGQEMAKNLTKFGLPCKYICKTESPRLLFLHFAFSDIATVTPSKINLAIKRLELISNYNFEYSESKISHFALIFVKEKPETVNISGLAPPPQNKFAFVAGLTTKNIQLNITLDEAIHILIAGTTGSGKTVFLKNLLYTMAFSNSPDVLKYAIIDKKRTLNFYSRISHCLGVANTDKDAIYYLNRFRQEMYRRYDIMQKRGIEKNRGLFPKWVLIVDELADLMLTENKGEIEEAIVSLCQLGRAAGIHCILCTQSPRVAVVSGLIQANTPTKIIFKTANIRESVLCLGHKGAENLLGSGDCLIKLPNEVEEYRVQTPYASEDWFRYVVGG